jgi:hypothetical protein
MQPYGQQEVQQVEPVSYATIMDGNVGYQLPPEQPQAPAAYATTSNQASQQPGGSYGAQPAPQPQVYPQYQPASTLGTRPTGVAQGITPQITTDSDEWNYPEPKKKNEKEYEVKQPVIEPLIQKKKEVFEKTSTVSLESDAEEGGSIFATEEEQEDPLCYGILLSKRIQTIKKAHAVFEKKYGSFGTVDVVATQRPTSQNMRAIMVARSIQSLVKKARMCREALEKL